MFIYLLWKFWEPHHICHVIQGNWGPVLEFFISLRKELKSQFRRKLENTFTRTKDGAGVLAASQEETERMQ